MKRRAAWLSSSLGLVLERGLSRFSDPGRDSDLQQTAVLACTNIDQPGKLTDQLSACCSNSTTAEIWSAKETGDDLDSLM